MDSTVSISKGVFVFKNGATSAKTPKKSKKSAPIISSSLLDAKTTSAPWYQAYSSLWNQLNTKIEDLQKESYNKIYNDLIKFMQESDSLDIDTIPTAALLTGINQSDHIAQFNKLCKKLESQLDALIIVLESRNCPTSKATIESLITSFMEAGNDEVEKPKRHQLNLWCFQKWYEREYGSDRPQLVVMMPDFEGFVPEVLQNLILVLHGYRETLPFVFVFGVATSFAAIHETLPFNVTNKITVKVFQADPSPVILNNVIDQVLLSPDCPFHLSGTTFRMLTDIFLFYDFSVHGFVQGFKYCMMEHFSQGNIYALCSKELDKEKIIKELTKEDLEALRHLPSFRRFVETRDDPRVVIKLLTNDDYLRAYLPSLIEYLQRFWQNFHCSLEMLHQLCANLPKAPYGKHLRELYRTAMSIEVSEGPEFKEILQLLTFMSKDEILDKFRAVLKILEKYHISEQAVDLKNLLEKSITDIASASMHVPEPETKTDQSPATKSLAVTSRFELKAKLLEAAKQPKAVSPYMQLLSQTINDIKNFISENLLPLSKAPPFVELFVFTDHLAIKRHIMGAPRAAIHQALNNPAHYLQCECCELENDDTKLLPTMPDVSIVYKLHLECGKMINMFDWLQSFKIVVDEKPIDADEEDEDDDTTVDPKIQARFTRAVAELQFLGFIKPTKKKTDHVQRLTW
ncbi:origin recognition complex subunit 3 [Culicoides brevitarsis]|uniref:origin recognition complex subunit 3 n=1 Tax=Culicoides brevitarsis TaxID=469753 RepID=UPI00307B32E6